MMPTMSMRTTQLTYYRGRVGLHAVLKALGVGPGDEVITQAYTCVAVPEAILATGADVAYADIEPGGLNLDPESVLARLGPKTRAIIVQHTFGLPAQMEALVAMAHARGVPIIEDCCHTLSGQLGGRELGSFGVAAFYSYEWGKPLVVGVGGSVRANDLALAATLRRAHRNYRRPSLTRQLKLAAQFAGFGAVYHPRLYWPVRDLFRRLARSGAVEGNYNELGAGEVDEEFELDMAPMQRALLSLKCGGVAEDAARRRRIVACYRDALGSYEGLFDEPPDADVVYARLPLWVADKPALLEAARASGIELAQWYTTPIHPLEGDALRQAGYTPGSCPQAESRCASVVSLPTHGRVSARFAERAGRFIREHATPIRRTTPTAPIHYPRSEQHDA